MNHISYLKPAILEWLENIQDHTSPWGRWPYHAKMSRPWALIGSGQAIRILKLLDELPAEGSVERKEAVAFLQNAQQPDGTFWDALVTEGDLKGPHSVADIQGQMLTAATALDLLDAQPRYPFPSTLFTECHPDEAGPWLESLNWANPWHVGERFARSVQAWMKVYGKEALSLPFEWIRAHVIDNSTGMPTLGGCKDPQVAMAGLFKLLFAFRSAGLPYPFPERAIESTLACAGPEGDWDGERFSACMPFDGLMVLRVLDGQCNGQHQHQAIVAAADRCCSTLLKKWRMEDGAFAFHRQGCATNHHSVHLSDEQHRIGDTIGTFMALNCFAWCDYWHGDEDIDLRTIIYQE